MREFKGGLSELRRVAERLGKTPPKAGGNLHPEVPPKTERSVRSFIPRSLGERNVPPAASKLGIGSKIDRGFRQVFGPRPNLSFNPPPSKPASPLANTIAWRNVYGPEDREAVKHLAEGGSSGTFEDLPRAARVAMVMRAEQIMRDEGKQNRVVSFLAAAARSGRPEIAANFSPRKLERVLGSLLGGKQAALQALWTPEVSKIVERYQTERKVVQEKLQTLERTLPAEGVANSSSPKAPEVSVPQIESSVGAVPSSPVAPRADGRIVEAMFRRNDLLHLRTHGEGRKRQLAEQASRSAERAMPEAASVSRSETSLPAVDAPARRSSTSPAAGGGKRERSEDRRRLEGTLTLISGNGETIGSAVLQGRERNG
jgi:hypothetical protein